MRVEYHPAVAHDVAEALRRYDAVSERLGNEFKAELRRVVAIAARNPNRFHLIKPGFHRANLKRFPYHFIYRELADGFASRWFGITGASLHSEWSGSDGGAGFGFVMESRSPAVSGLHRHTPRR